MRAMRTVARSLACAGIVLSALAAPAEAEVYGLIIGINEYRDDRLRDLHGAVNDANDIYEALNSTGAAQVTRLLDGDATRERIMAAWKELVGKAVPGDTIVVTYAGHGAQQPERIAGSEDDGRDEMFQLTGYSRDASGNAQRILDDDLNAMFKAAHDLHIIFVADSCHSGTMTRSFDPRAGELSVRGGGYEIIEDDQLPPASAEDANISEAELDNVLFFGAVKDSQLVVELPVEQEMRGVLSWAFARALRGAADMNGDKVLTAAELEVYLRETVRIVSEGRQLPQMARRSRSGEIALVLPGGVAPAEGLAETGGTGAAQSPSTQQGAAGTTPVDTSSLQGGERSVRLSIIGTDDPQRFFEKLFDVAPAKEGLADLVWDISAHELVSSTGDVVARLDADSGPEDVQPLIEKWLLLRELKEIAGAEPLSLRFRRIQQVASRGDRDATGDVNPEGTQLLFQVAGHNFENITVFNLAMDGKVQYLIPVPEDTQAHYRGEAVPGQEYAFPLVVQGPGPFGAEHLVVLASREPLVGLHEQIMRIDQRAMARELRGILAEHLKGQTFQVGYVALFSGPKK